MPKQTSWKQKLLSSSIPLEYESATILSKHGFQVQPDYAYRRNDTGIVKEFSVDIRAYSFAPFTNPNVIKSELSLLIECKYRHPNIFWLFLPDPNPSDTPLVVGPIIKVIDTFSPWRVLDPILSIEDDIPIAYKGIEIDTSNGNVYDSELRHGLYQLLFAIPRLIAEDIRSAIIDHLEDNVPLYYTQILLTTARLFVTTSKFKIEDVKYSKNINDFTTEVPFISVFVPTGPEFREHCINEFKILKDITTYRNFNTLCDRSNNFNDELKNPRYLIKLFLDGLLYTPYWSFENVLICNIKNFDKLISYIKNAVSLSTRKRKNILA